VYICIKFSTFHVFALEQKLHEACSFWLNFCTSLSFFLFFPERKKRKKDELVQKFSQKEQAYD